MIEYGGESWRIPLDHPGAYVVSYVGMRETTPSRCFATIDDWRGFGAVPEDLLGSIEVMRVSASPVADTYDRRTSIFVRQNASGEWKVIGYTSTNTEECLGSGDEPEYFRFCNIYYYGIDAWALEEEARR
jgi:hypothetical protein